MKEKKAKIKKPIYKKWWFYVLIVVLLAAAFGGKKTEAPAPAEPATSTELTAPVPELSVVLDAADAGDFGREIVLNAGTEDEYAYFGYFFPAGHYRATYTEGKAWAQISFLKDETQINEDGFEEAVISEKRPILANVGEPVEFDLVEGEYIKLPDGQKNVLIEKIG